MKVQIILFLVVLSFQEWKTQVLVIAHRGASAVAPENTISAFDAAIKIGTDYIETDVHLTSDGIPVLMHDLTVNRTCNLNCINKNKSGKIYIRDITANEFNKLKIKNKNETPPTLDSAIRFINGRCKLLIELKKGSDYYPGIEAKIKEVIEKYNAGNWVNIIHSFDKKLLLEMQHQQSGIRLQKLIIFRFPLGSFTFSKGFEKDNLLNWQGVNSNYLFTTRKLIKKLHKEGKTVYAWTVNRKKWAKKLIDRGVDGIITDNPAMLKEILAKK